MRNEVQAFIPNAAFLADHLEVPRPANLVVRLRPGTDVAAFGRRAAEATGLPNLPVRDQAEDTKRVTHGTDMEGNALLLLAAAVALAGVVLVGQALSRTVYGFAGGGTALRALGFTRPELGAGLVLPLVVTAVTGMFAAAVTALALPVVPRRLRGQAGARPGHQRRLARHRARRRRRSPRRWSPSSSASRSALPAAGRGRPTRPPPCARRAARLRPADVLRAE